jgi:hypothetical protein
LSTSDPAAESGASSELGEPSEPQIDATVAHPARIYDYLLGGVDNFEADREAAERGAEAVGGMAVAQAQVRAQRRYLGRAVRWLAADAGIRQFLDIGTGIPNSDNFHRVAQDIAPDTRIVYVDNDPIVLAHAHSLLKSTPDGVTAYVDGDLREPERILEQAAATLDFDRPVAIVLVGILHLIRNDEDPWGIVARLLAAVPSGSYLAISHMASDIETESMTELASRMSRQTPATWTVRSRDEVARFFDGLELVPPGLVPMDQWPEPEPPAPGPLPPPGSTLPGYGAVGRKP